MALSYFIGGEDAVCKEDDGFAKTPWIDIKFENNKSQIQEQIYNINKIISKNNIVKNHFDLFSQNKDVQNISKITVKEKPDIELTTNHENVEEKNKVLEELNLKTKDIFAK